MNLNIQNIILLLNEKESNSVWTKKIKNKEFYNRFYKLLKNNLKITTLITY